MSDTNTTQFAEVLDKDIKDLAKKLFEDGATLGELKGITPRELNAIYQMGPAERLLWPGRASPSASQLLAFSPGKEQAAGVWET